MVSWDYTKAEYKIIRQIAKRAVDRWRDWIYAEVEMDIAATHCNGCPLDLQKLLEFDDFNFTHDMMGIHSNIDRDTGELKNHFLPRSAGRAIVVED